MIIINLIIVSSEVQLNTTSIVFEGAIGEQCIIVTVADGDTNMDNHSYNLILERSREMSSVPVEIYLPQHCLHPGH